MNASPDLIRELQASHPVAPYTLRARVRELATHEAVPSARSWRRLSARRAALVALPAAAALALVSAGAIGLSRSAPSTQLERGAAPPTDSIEGATATPTQPLTGTALDNAIGPTPGRAARVSATLVVEVADSDAVSRAAQDVLDLTRSLGGHVVSASVATGEEGSAVLTVRVPVGNVQDAIAQLSGLGRIVSQQVTIDDLQERLDTLTRREASVRNQLARIAARLASGTLDPETHAVLQARRNMLRGELRTLRAQLDATNAEARLATIQLSVVTPGAQGVVPVPSRLDRMLDEALNVLAWEGVVALAVAIVLAPFALIAAAAWLGRRLYRRREEERLLAAS